MTLRECRMAIEEWLEEISEELGFLAKRKEEVEKEKEDFINRVKTLENDFANY
jgi:predicted nuclease with TOPRIM domain